MLGEEANYGRPRLSPDGSLLAVEILDPDRESADLWIYDVAQGTRSRFTFGPGSETNVCWWPDGKSLVYAARGDTCRVFRKPLTGTGGEELLFTSGILALPCSVSPDGRYLMLGVDDAKTNWDLIVLPLSGERRPVPFLQTPASESPAVFSPDGRWVTYTADESGEWQTYVTSFPQAGRKWQISEENGSYPNWSPDGKEISYVRYDGTLVAVEVDASGDTFRMTRSRVLGRVGVPGGEGEDYTFTPDSRRWLSIHDPAQEGGVGSLEVILGWKELLKE
jgi:Tol biopolymer transport system component